MGNIVGIDREQCIKQVNQYIDAHREDMMQFWKELVSIESGNESQKEGVDEICSKIAEELRGCGAETQTIQMEKKGNFLLADWGKGREKKPVLFIGHMDTVFKEGAAKQNPFRVDEDGNAHGPGVLDMKAGLTIAVFIVKALNDAGYNERPVKIAFAGDEENGHRESGAAAVMLEACEGVAAAFNFETGYLDDGLVVGRKGSFRMTVEVQGVASHSGNAPEKGRNAILEMSYKIIELQNLNDYEHGTSLNVGLITGGTVVNAVPDHCEIKIDIRFTQKERLDQLLEKIDEILAKTYVDGTKTIIHKTVPSAVMEDSEPVMALFHHIEKTAELTGYGKVKPIKVGGWSDSSLVASKGIPVVCGLGARGKGNHSPEEFAVVESVFERAKLIAASVILLDKDLV